MIISYSSGKWLSNFFKSMPLFSNCDFPSKYDCTYSMAFPYTMNFFEDNCDVLNDLSIQDVSLEEYRELKALTLRCVKENRLEEKLKDLEEDF